MTWVKLDDAFFLHPKAIAAGRDGRDVYLAALCYANQQLTDGVIPAHALPLIGTLAGVVDYDAAATRLVECRLWTNHVQGWEIHGYLERQQSKEQREEWLAKDRDKKRKQREAKKLTQVPEIVPTGIRRESHGNPEKVLSVDEESSREESSSSRPLPRTSSTAPSKDDDDELKATIRAIAEARTQRYNPANPDAYNAALTRDPDVHDKAGQLLERYPDLTPTERASCDQPPKPQQAPARRTCTRCHALTHTINQCPLKERT